MAAKWSGAGSEHGRALVLSVKLRLPQQEEVRITLRTTALTSIAIALMFGACAGGGDGNEKPTFGASDSSRAAEFLAFCFAESSLPDGFSLANDLAFVSSEEMPVEVAELYDDWGRRSVGRQSYSADDRPLDTAVLATTPALDGRFDSVSCTVEVYEDADGAGQAFEGSGFNGPLLAGLPDTGTFRIVASPDIAAESRQYLSVHAVVSNSAVLFRSGNVLARVDVVAPSSSFSGAEKTGLVAEAGRLALVLLEQIESMR